MLLVTATKQVASASSIIILAIVTLTLYLPDAAVGVLKCLIAIMFHDLYFTLFVSAYIKIGNHACREILQTLAM